VALGELSGDQARFRDIVVSGTGLDSATVTAWIGAESGWNITKANHNYLNIGPGMGWSTVDEAGAATVHLLNTSNYYKGIRDAIPAGAASQIAAIKSSPWDAGHYANGALDKIFGSLGGVAVQTVGVADAASTMSEMIGRVVSGFGWVANPAHILRIFKGALGVAAVGFGGFLIAKDVR